MFGNRKQFLKIAVITMLLLPVGKLYSQNNRFNLNGKLLDYYDRFQLNGRNVGADKIIDSMLVQAQMEKDVRVQCLVKSMYVDYYYYINDSINLFKAQKECARFIKNKPYKDFLFIGWNRILNFYTNNHYYSKALDALKEYENAAINYNNDYGIAQSYRKLGDIYFSQGLTGLSAREYNKAADYANSKGDIISATTCYLSLGALYMNVQNYKKMIFYADKILNSANTNESFRLAALIHKFSANASLGNYKEAAKYKVIVDEQSKKTGILGNNLRCYLHGCVYFYLYRNNFAQAKKCRDLFLEVEPDEINRLAVDAQWYTDNKEYEKANKVWLRLVNVKDSLNMTENKEMQARLSSSFDMDRMQLKQKELELQELATQQKFHITLFILMGVVLVGLILLAYRKRKLANKAEEAKQKARAAQLEAEKANKLKSAYLANMSHDIRTPLTAIVGFNKLLNEPMDGVALNKEDKEEMVKMIDINIETITQLVNDILDMSKFESGTYQLSLSDTPVNLLCRTIMHSIQNKLIEKNVNLVFSPQCDDNFTINTDVVRLQQVITNFMTNACKYTDSGEIELKYIILDDKITFSVRDTGIGIKPEDAEACFDRYRMLDHSVKGHGLGLHICKMIADLLHGRVWVDTSYKKGSLFLFELPLK